MDLIFETADISAYLEPIPQADFRHPAIQTLIQEIRARAAANLGPEAVAAGGAAGARIMEEQARLAFLYARDQIRHSFDLNSDPITICAADAVAQLEGICFAKSHVLAALLRGLAIPAGFCYQRVTRKGTPESGYALHGLNAAFLAGRGWFRLDPRGNKPGVDSQFSIQEERLAYPIREALGEVDYPYVFARPDPAVLTAMEQSKDCHELFFRRPEALHVNWPQVQTPTL